MLVPKLVTTLETYDREQLAADIGAGIIVGIVALPLAIAFAIASGVTPDRGLYTAIIAGFLISALGGSRVQIGGPTGAFVVIVYAIVQQHGVDGLLVATIMAGLILIVLGLSGLGNAIKFIPHAVIIGFTSGIALIIFSSQIKDLFGLRMGEMPSEFIEKWASFAVHIRTANPDAVGLAAFAAVIVVLWPRVSRRVPAPFVALVAGTAAARLLHLDVETIGSRFGEISSAFPSLRIPQTDLATVRMLVGPAFTIALLAGIESLLSAVVADGMIGGRHRSNMELVAQGVANVASPLFGGIPATGAIARTATNVRNGGRTPVAGIVHALTLLVITLFFGKWAAWIPFPVLAVILVTVAYHMSEWRGFVGEMSAPKSDVVVMLTTFLLTILVDLTVAIQAGMVLASFLFMKRMAEVTNVQVVSREFNDDSAGDRLNSYDLPEGTVVFNINGPFFFGAATTFKQQVEPVVGKPAVMIFRMTNVPVMDSTGLHALREIVRRSRAEGTVILLAEPQEQPLTAMRRARIVEAVGESNVFSSMDSALMAARAHSSPDHSGDDLV